MLKIEKKHFQTSSRVFILNQNINISLFQEKQERNSLEASQCHETNEKSTKRKYLLLLKF